MKNIKTLKLLCKNYIDNKQELENSESKKLTHVEEIRNKILKNQVYYVEKELHFIREECGELAYKVIYENFINNISIVELQSETNYSKTQLYRKMEEWIRIYENK